jgi:hypothetical protein
MRRSQRQPTRRLEPAAPPGVETPGYTSKVPYGDCRTALLLQSRRDFLCVARGFNPGRAGSTASITTILAAFLSLLPACTDLPPIDLERMIYQDKFEVWQHCDFFPDGRAMRTPPLGTIPRDQPIGDPAVDRGVVDGRYVTDIPVPLTRALLDTGRARFDVYCAPCHGVRGDGASVVALNMDLRKPPVLAGPAARALPAGRVYQVIDEGYGLMRSYREDVTSPEERWAVVAYLMALQLSHGVPLSSLPPDVRREAERQLQ